MSELNGDDVRRFAAFRGGVFENDNTFASRLVHYSLGDTGVFAIWNVVVVVIIIIFEVTVVLIIVIVSMYKVFYLSEIQLSNSPWLLSRRVLSPS